MQWIEKGQPTPFDNAPIPGLFFVDGDVANRKRHTPWTQHWMRPIIVFPSGAHCELFGVLDQEKARVDISGALDVPLIDAHAHALAEAQEVAKDNWYLFEPIDDHSFVVTADAESAIVVYEPESRRLSNVIFSADTGANLYAISSILDDKAQELLQGQMLPEPLALNAIAQVRYSLPHTGWAWYATAFDRHDTFYGLVIENDIQCATFSLTDLARLRGPHGYGVEHDYDFEPTTLGELKMQYERLRSKGQPSFPTNSVAREDLLSIRPDLEHKIAALDDSEIERIADKVGDALSEDYWTALSIILESYLGVPEAGDEEGDELLDMGMGRTVWDDWETQAQRGLDNLPPLIKGLESTCSPEEPRQADLTDSSTNPNPGC